MKVTVRFEKFGVRLRLPVSLTCLLIRKCIRSRASVKVWKNVARTLKNFRKGVEIFRFENEKMLISISR